MRRMSQRLAHVHAFPIIQNGHDQKDYLKSFVIHIYMIYG